MDRVNQAIGLVELVNIFFLILAFQFPTACGGAVVVSLNLLYFSNPGHRMWNGDCCEYSCGPCDYEFIVCFSRKASSVYTQQGERHCDYGRRQTGELDEDDESFYLPLTFRNGQSNPINVAVPAWEGGVRVSIEVRDIDMWMWDQNDLIVEYAIDLNNWRPAQRAEDCDWYYYFLFRGYTRLHIQYKMFCAQYYYGHNCEIYCRPRNDRSGHYTCDPVTGRKTCYPNYYGYNCGVYCRPPRRYGNYIGYNCGVYCRQPRKYGFDHYTCDPETGRKVCYRGYYGYGCQYKYVPNTPPPSTKSTEGTPSPFPVTIRTTGVTSQGTTSSALTTPASDSPTSSTATETTLSSTTTETTLTSTMQDTSLTSTTQETTLTSTTQETTLTSTTQEATLGSATTETTLPPATTDTTLTLTTTKTAMTSNSAETTHTPMPPTSDDNQTTGNKSFFHTFTPTEDSSTSTSTVALQTSTFLSSAKIPEQTSIVESTVKDTTTSVPILSTGISWTQSNQRSPASPKAPPSLNKSEKPESTTKVALTMKTRTTPTTLSSTKSFTSSSLDGEHTSTHLTGTSVKHVNKSTQTSKPEASTAAIIPSTSPSAESSSLQTSPGSTSEQSHTVSPTSITYPSSSSLSMSTLLSTSATVRNRTSIYPSSLPVTSSPSELVTPPGSLTPLSLSPSAPATTHLFTTNVTPSTLTRTKVTPIEDTGFPVQTSLRPCWILNKREGEVRCNCTDPPKLPGPFPWIHIIDINTT